MRDTGKGIEKEAMERIFEPFYTTKGVGEGTGLGLSMVYGIVKQHGGHIVCHSELDQGTAFQAYFPALEGERVGERKTMHNVVKGGTETILLVDDEQLIRDLGSRILSRAGYTVIQAANGRQALDVYRERGHGVSLIILDVVMPEMGGEQCLPELLKINPDLKVIIASGFSSSGPGKATLESGARGFVNKPFNMSQMLQTVRSVLDED